MKTSELIKWLLDTIVRDGDRELKEFSLDVEVGDKPKRVIDLEYQGTENEAE